MQFQLCVVLDSYIRLEYYSVHSRYLAVTLPNKIRKTDIARPLVRDMSVFEEFEA